MIIDEFARYLQKNKSDYFTPSSNILINWLKYKLKSTCVTNNDKILHKEIYIATNKIGCIFFIARSESGRVLLKALYNFCEYYDNYKKAKKNNTL